MLVINLAREILLASKKSVVIYKMKKSNPELITIEKFVDTTKQARIFCFAKNSKQQEFFYYYKEL